MKKFEYVIAGIMLIAAFYVVPWSYNHWMAVTSGQGSYSSSTSVVGSPSISGTQIDAILCKAKSPACGTGYALYNYGVQYNINPAFSLAVFRHESSYGTAGEATKTLSLGNLRCIPNAACVDGYAAFPSWDSGYVAFYKLISGPLYVGRGLTTPNQIFPVYAPAGADGNNPTSYATAVNADMVAWRNE